jgi:large subunit ribosomal protein L15e
MGMYKYIKESIISEYKERPAGYKHRMVEWNTGPTVARIERPTNLSRARELGYKAKEGIIIVRVKVGKGKHKRVMPGGGRKPSRSGRFFSGKKSMQSIAEEKAARKFSNFEVSNSYFAGSTGQKHFYEVILVNPANQAIRRDRIQSQITAQRGRAYRGLTSSGKKHRGLRNKGVGAEKVRPSVRQNERH